MPSPIPTLALGVRTDPAAPPAGVWMPACEPGAPPRPCFRPFRSSYYAVGLCLRGHAALQVNLETYQLQPGCLLALPAYAVKQWHQQSADFEALEVLFTADFLAPAPGGSLGQLAYFSGAATPVLALPPELAARLQAAFEQLHHSYHEPHPYRPELVQSYLRVLLYEAAAAYAATAGATGAAPTSPPRALLIARQFKQLVCAHCTRERQLAFYAGRLCLTPKHLTETVRAATGRGAASLVAEAVTLEARLRLHNPALTVAQVADQLHFADQSAFARYFRRTAGQSPTAYRDQLRAEAAPFSDFLPDTTGQKPELS